MNKKFLKYFIPTQLAVAILCLFVGILDICAGHIGFGIWLFVLSAINLFLANKNKKILNEEK
jgi:hypothetical protein